MSALIPTLSIHRKAPRVLAAFATALVLLATTAITPPALAQDQSAQQGAAQLLTAEQLDQLVAPIALYPDNLLGQILTASTYPLETVMAARWSQSNPNLKGPQLENAMQQQNWDPSVKALTSVPQVLSMMNDKLDWTQELGEAYLAQPDDVAAAVQRLRLKAQAAGNLHTNAQQRVSYVPAPQPIVIDNVPQPNYIAIDPVDPDVIYVPVYNPVVVYGPWAYPAYPPFFWSPPGFVFGVGGVGIIAFGAPFVVGAAIWAHYDWKSHHVDIDPVRFDRFNHTNIMAAGGNKPWQFDPSHRGNTPFKSAVLEQKFGNAIHTNASVNPKGNPEIFKPNNTLGNTNKNNLGNTGNNQGKGNPELKGNTLTNLNKGNTGGNNQGNEGGNGQIKTNNLEKLNTGNNNGNNNNNERKFEERKVDLNKGNNNNNNNNNQVHIQQQNIVQHNNPPPPPPHVISGPPGGQSGQGGQGGKGNEKDKKHP
jgi:hypothetical protein